jgi:hypothetical protein
MRREAKRSRNSAVDRKRKEARGKTFHHSVYVILLDPAVLRHPAILRLNPNRDPAKPCVYVGMTGLVIEDRFENHKKGVKSAWVVEKYGVRLMPELYEYLKSDAIRSSGSDGKGFGRRSARGRLHGHWRHLGLDQLLGSDAGCYLEARGVEPLYHCSAPRNFYSAMRFGALL